MSRKPTQRAVAQPKRGRGSKRGAQATARTGAATRAATVREASARRRAAGPRGPVAERALALAEKAKLPIEREDVLSLVATALQLLDLVDDSYRRHQEKALTSRELSAAVSAAKAAGDLLGRLGLPGDLDGAGLLDDVDDAETDPKRAPDRDDDVDDLLDEKKRSKR